MHAVFALSASASIRLILIAGNRKSSATRSHCFLIPRRKSFAVTTCYIPAQARKAPILPDPPSFLSIPAVLSDG